MFNAAEGKRKKKKEFNGEYTSPRNEVSSSIITRFFRSPLWKSRWCWVKGDWRCICLEETSVYWRYSSQKRVFPMCKQMCARMTPQSVSPFPKSPPPQQQLGGLVRSKKESLNASDQIITCHYQLGERLFAAAPGPITLRSSPSLSLPPSAVDDSDLDALHCACVQILNGWECA